MYTVSPEKKSSSLVVITCLTLIFLLSGCAGQQVIDGEVAEVDPYEGFNRTMFGFNDTVDTYIAEPISDAYSWITPRFVQTGVANFFDNLKGVNVVLNDLMQGKGQQGAEDTGRFLINSTVGIFGLFDVASEVGLEKHDEDFAQTLAVWGVSQGPYLVLPLLGPTTSRGIPGGIFDAAANPVTYVGAPVQLLNVLNVRANASDELDFIEEAALDPYVFTRESFLQYRKNLISDGQLEDSDALFDFDDEDFDDEDFEQSESKQSNVNAEQPSIQNDALDAESEIKEKNITEDVVTLDGHAENNAETFNEVNQLGVSQ